MSQDIISPDSAADTAVEARMAQPWNHHPINIRFSVPFVGSRFYFTLVAGRERRTHERRHEDRTDHPLLTWGNAFFAMGLTTIAMLAALVTFIAQSSIIE
ncbi:hypothetical protein V5T82_00460 [Magnetovibrio sp. PR-2]|uniref:hypothetical protein n=1 Tax=Magnetovibrio sp. PR-2 TaxID=3120356 RepID=UPI002FCE2EE9